MGKIRTRVFEVVDLAKPGDKLSRAFDYLIMSLIALNLLAVVMETIKSVREVFGAGLLTFEHITVAVFTVEYVLRIWSCTSDPRYARPIVGRIRYALTPLVIIDLLAIAPFYLPMLIPLDLIYIRAIRLFRFVRVLKLRRYSRSVQLLEAVFKSKNEDLLISMMLIIIALLVASSVMYYLEAEAQPGQFSSIPAAMWWGVTTMTTVGYGDMVPVTAAGKLVASVIQLLGLALVALPTGIIAAGFIEEKQKQSERPKCPHCGKEL